MAELENQREFHRGEVWWFSDPGRYEYEYGGGRPALIVSSEKGCERAPTVQVVFLTTSLKYGVLNVPIAGADKPRTAMCGSITTLSKERADRCMYTATPEEMAEIERGLMAALGLNGVEVPDNSENESEIERLNEEILAKDLEIAMFQKLYEKTMDQLVSMKFDSDLHRKQGVSAPVARCIIAGRPYMSVEDLRIVPGMTKVGYGIISKKVTVGDTGEFVKKKQPKKEETASDKVNVNTASAVEIHEKTGLAMCACYAITGKRNREGQFKSLDDLVIPKRLSEATLSKYRDKMEV